MRHSHFFILSVGALVLAGCGASPAATEAGEDLPVHQVKLNVSADSGVPVEQSTDAARFNKLVALRSTQFTHRSDPFALTRTEEEYDRQQEMERVFSNTGGFTVEYQPPVDNKPAPVFQEQPYRRLAGVVVGDSVLAIIDMGNGQTEIIRPGEKVPNSDWTVVSIDQEKAVLRRSGNVLPHEVIVRLESPPPGFNGSSVGGGSPYGPGNGGMMPGAPGAPGAPGRGMNPGMRPGD